jgi:hypothetical protein
MILCVGLIVGLICQLVRQRLGLMRELAVGKLWPPDGVDSQEDIVGLMK